MSTVVAKHIFREYDIRGIWGKDLTEYVAHLIGKAYGTFLRRNGANKVIVGHDNRASSPQLHSALIDGLLSTGCDVIDIGETLTPIVYFARHQYGVEGGVMITGSHNPSEYNGFKLCWGAGTLFGKQIQHIREIAETGEFETGSGKVTRKNATSDYYDWIADHIKLGSKRLKVVVDAGNGTAGPIVPPLLRRLGCDVIELYCESDNTFPKHHPDPVKEENLRDLIAKVIESKADVGLGFDGDGDRLGVIDDKGNIMWGDYLLILFSREILGLHPGAKIIVEVKCSQAAIEEIERAGGIPILSRTGHSFIKDLLHKEGALLAGEMSGHMFFADEYFGFDDAVYAACRLLRILSNAEVPLSQLLADVPKYYNTPEVGVPCPDDIKFEVVAKAVEDFKRKYKVIDIDGARVVFEDGWGLVRASNTEAKLILRAEGKTPEALERIKGIVAEELSKLLQIPPSDLWKAKQ
ncbi:MAG: phosphomannomutase/phosphoglucomutase [Armatimonadota bacterium]|nr:phosphomannomutase/phosphoglucomutase [Armatimonadota bacterium]MCX7777766.1 phosphomannomutase/phosphoglucomutase [Armatimonadota bacterium]MDW8025423.1 phosphomannomutase/phosphoglucomutase [Armatimonadota bacterium]